MQQRATDVGSLAEPAICEYSKQQPVSDLLADMSHTQLFSHMLYVPLVQSEVTPKDRLSSQLAAARTEISADALPEFNFDAELKHRATPGTYVDSQAWKPALYGEHATCGVVASARDGPAEYGVVVRTGSGPAGERFYDFAAANKSMTIGALLESPQYRLAADLSERNALRLAAQVGAAIVGRPGRPVHNVMKVREDRKAVPAFVGAALPLAAVPAVHVRYNTLVETPSGGVAFLRHVGAPHNGQMLHQRDHMSGFAVSRCGDETPARRVFDVNHHATQDDNAAYSQLKARNRNEWRLHVQKHYLTPGGQAATSAAPPLWSVSERKAPAADATLLYPEAMVIQAKPATKSAE